MLRPITCGRCKGNLGWFDDRTGCLRSPSMPDGVHVFGVFLHCAGCGSRYKFDGEKAVKKLRRKRRADALSASILEVGAKTL